MVFECATTLRTTEAPPAAAGASAAAAVAASAAVKCFTRKRASRGGWPKVRALVHTRVDRAEKMMNA